MKRLLHMLDIVRGRPGMAFLNRFAILDAAQDVLLDAECCALCVHSWWVNTEPIPDPFPSVEACRRTEREFERARNQLGQ